MDKIVVVGLSGESIFLTVDHFNEIGETVSANNLFTEPGGKGYNQAIALKRLGADVSFITALGADNYSKSSLAGLQDEDIIHYVISKKESSALAVIITDSSGENKVTVHRGIYDKLEISDFIKYQDVFKDAKYLLIQNEMPIDTVYDLIKFASSFNIKVIFNPAPAVRLDENIYKYIYLMTPNEHEAKVIFGLNNDADIYDIIKKSKEHKLNRLIVTLGSKGVLVYEDGIIDIIPPRKVQAVDTTGAGDSFNSALVYGLSIGMSLKDSAIFGNIAASISVTKRGIIGSMPYLSDVMKVYKNE